jgi:2-haloacid dehalogenase
MTADVRGVKALAFDVFGTVVDWSGTLAREGARLGQRYNLTVDWRDFAGRWAQKYVKARETPLPWRPLDQILRQAGQELLDEFRISGLAPQDRTFWLDAWSRLDPWEDVIPGLTLLRERCQLVALSNANVALGEALAAHAKLPWHRVLGPDAVQAYKPDPRVYRAALRELGFEPHEVMMVAAHLYDLEGASAVGLRTAFVPRPGEGSDDPHAPYINLRATDFRHLAARLLA